MAIKVALAGATGNLGPAILKGLLDAGFDVTILSRKGSTSTDSLPAHSQQTIVKVDYSDSQGIIDVLKGVNTVVSNLPATEAAAEKTLIDASVVAGVQRYLPSEFGSDIDNPLNAALPVFQGKAATRKYLEGVVASNPSLSYTYVINNAFFDWGLKVGFVANPKAHTAILYDGGDVKFSTTTLATVGKAVAGVINHQDATKNRSVYVHDAAVTVNQLIAITKEIDGKEWTAEVKDTKEFEQASYAELQKENPNIGQAMYGFLFRAAFSRDHAADFTKKLDNELLGLSQFTDEQVKEVVKSVL